MDIKQQSTLSPEREDTDRVNSTTAQPLPSEHCQLAAQGGRAQGSQAVSPSLGSKLRPRKPGQLEFAGQGSKRGVPHRTPESSLRTQHSTEQHTSVKKILEVSDWVEHTEWKIISPGLRGSDPT